MKTFESKFNIDRTVVEIENSLKKMNTSAFTIIEKENDSAIILGSSKIRGCGSKHTVELPLKIMVWQDENGMVWVAFKQMKEKAERYGLHDCAKVDKIDNILMSLAIVS